jgi:quercetin dioxygenase-like cupin family protein
MPGMSVRAGGPSIDALTQRLAAEGLAAQAWGNGPGDRYAVHEHAYDKVLVAVAGSITFSLPAAAGRLTLDQGDRLDLPAGTPHGALVGPAGVTCLEAHLARGSLAGVPVHHPGWGLSDDDGAPETVHGRMA